MTTTEYWRRELAKASELLGVESPDPEMVAALMVAGQLHTITTMLSEIRAQLAQIEDAIANN